MKKVSRYFTFTGRAPRGEVWKVILILPFLLIVASLLLMLVLKSFISVFSIPIPNHRVDDVTLIIAAVPFFYVFLATIVRRMHDLNWSALWLLSFLAYTSVFTIGNMIFEKTGHFFWWMWIFVPPLIACFIFVIYGWIALFIKLGTEGANNYGDNPLEQ